MTAVLYWHHFAADLFTVSGFYCRDEVTRHFPPISLSYPTHLSGESPGIGLDADGRQQVSVRALGQVVRGIGCVSARRGGASAGDRAGLGVPGERKANRNVDGELQHDSAVSPRGLCDLWIALPAGGGARDWFPVMLVPPPRRGRGACPALVSGFALPQCANRSQRDGRERGNCKI